MESLTQKIGGYQTLEELRVQLRKRDYSPEAVQESLAYNRADTTEAIIEEIRRGNLKVNTNNGKNTLRILLQHYKQLELEDELSYLKERLYEVIMPPIERKLLDILAEGFAGILGVLYLGRIPPDDVISAIREVPFNRQLSKILDSTQ